MQLQSLLVWITVTFLALDPAVAPAPASSGAELAEEGEARLSYWSRALDSAAVDEESITAYEISLQRSLQRAVASGLDVLHAVKANDAVNARLALAALLVAAKRPKAAIRHYEILLRARVSDPARVHVPLGDALLTLGQHARAEGRYRVALRWLPALHDLAAQRAGDRAKRALAAGARRGLGRTLASRSADDEAHTMFSEAVELEPANLEGRMYFGTLLLRRGRCRAAIGQLREAAHASSSTMHESDFLLGLALRRCSDWQQAERHLAVSTRKNSTCVICHAALGETRIVTGDMEGARAALQVSVIILFYRITEYFTKLML